MGNDLILKVEGISKRFTGTVALDNVNFELKRGEIHALVGANGAGKSTLIKILTGAYRSDSGKIFLDGKQVEINSPSAARRLGISAVYQEFSLVNNLTVAENIYLGKLPRNKSLINTVNWSEAYKNAYEILKHMDSCIDPKALVKNLSVAQRQLVEIAKALSNNSRILIMDEPTASLTDNDIENMFKVIKGLANKGISIIYVSHRLEELPVIADRVTVFRDGKYIVTLNIEDAPKQVIIDNMVGKGLTHSAKTKKSSEEVLLEVKNFSSGKLFSNISFKLHKGEILGIAGLAGAGRTELVRAIFGADPKDSGEIWVKGKKVKINKPSDAKELGIGFVTEDRKEEGLVLGLDVQSNISMTVLKKLTKFFVMTRKKERELAKHFVDSVNIKTSGLTQPVKNLSGGNQQKVIISKWLATKPSILILDEPTRGIDVGSKGQIYSLLNQLADEGMGIIMISSEIPEILEMSDRIIVMAGGQITGEISREEATQDKILHYATSKIKQKDVV